MSDYIFQSCAECGLGYKDKCHKCSIIPISEKDLFEWLWSRSREAISPTREETDNDRHRR